MVFSVVSTLTKMGRKWKDKEKWEKYHDIKEIWKSIFSQPGHPTMVVVALQGVTNT